jgi:protein-S-isoprenylcysteine O-methyltransferase Ste14
MKSELNRYKLSRSILPKKIKINIIRDSKKMTKKRTLPPTYFWSAVIAMLLLHFLLPLIRFIYFPWNMTGIILILAGITLNLLADSYFKKAGTTVKPFEKSTTLITESVFKISRHPMYLGMVLILTGLAVFLGTLTPFLIVITFFLIMETVFIRVEEDMMEEIFGAQYRDYRKKVRKWL